MKRTIAVLAAVAALVAVLAGCTGLGTRTPSIDPAGVDAVLTTNPEQAVVGDPTELRATVSGVGDTQDATVSFDIRVKGKSNLVDAVYGADGVFSAEFTFPEQGEYDILIHIYAADLHVIKKKAVQAQ